VQYHILILDTELEMGGKEKLLYQFIERTDRERFRIAVCCLKKGGYFKSRIEELGVPFYDGLLKHRFDALAFRELERVIRKEQTQIIYTFAHPNTVIFAYLAKLKREVESFVVSYHATGHAKGGRGVPAYLLPMLKRADALVAVANAHRDYLVRVEGLPREKIRVIHNGVDASLYRPGTDEERAGVRRLLGLQKEHIVIMTVASLKPLKRLDALIRSTATMLSADARLRLVIVGGGPDREALESLARTLGVADRVLMTGIRDDVNVLLRAADIFVLSSRTEAFPNVVLEAMATGLPVVTTDVGSVREMVEEGTSAFVVSPEDEASLSDAIHRLVNGADLRSRMGVRGRAIVDSRFRIETMCAAREALFEELAERHAPAETV
jgi:glycosyltransferase involved in cell wall biosynthesis